MSSVRKGFLHIILLTQGWYCRPGDTVQIIEYSNKDWWLVQSTVTGCTGYLPPGHLAQLHPGERAGRVGQDCSLHVAGGGTLQVDEGQVLLAMVSPVCNI